jgi:hypothetical protein
MSWRKKLLQRAGHRSALPAWFSRVEPDDLESPLVERILARLDEFAGRWHARPAGGSLTVSWPLRARTPLDKVVSHH